MESKGIKKQIKGALKKTKILYKRGSFEQVMDMPLPDIHEVLENLFRQVDNNEGDFIKEISIIRDKFIADSETIKMGLTQLLNSENDREAISSEKTIRLKEIADSILAQENSNMNDISKLQEKEKYLARLEKEIIEILSMRFKK